MKNIQTRLIIFMLLFFCMGKSFAQEHLFTVIASGGKALSKSASSSDWTAVKTGNKLFAGDKIKLAAKDYLALVGRSGKSIELKKEGQFEVSELAAKLRAQGGALTENFTKYVMTEMTGGDKKSKNMKMLGAVVRQGPGMIELDSPVSTALSDSMLYAAWWPAEKSENYVFHLLNPSGITIFMQTTTDAALKINLDRFNLQRDKVYKWFVASCKNNTVTSDTASFYLLSAEKLKAIKDTLIAIKSEVAAGESALNKLAYASFCEKHNLKIEAVQVYEQLFKENFAVEEFQVSYISLLINAGMQRRAQQLFEEWKMY